jgi:hypothetical protein
MFGLLNPGRQDLLFRRAYARCCQHQRRRYGLSSLAFLSYESILLYLCAADAGLLDLDQLPKQTCCKLRRLRGTVPEAEQAIERFCTSVGMLLTFIKVSDDLRDRPTLLMRLMNWLLCKRFRETFDYFSHLDSDFSQKVDAFVAEHLRLEAPLTSLPDREGAGRSRAAFSLEEYAQPTAAAFGYVFSLFGRLSGMETHAELLEELGEYVGKAIIAFDCAMDWHKDQRRGEFNPLPDGAESVEAALAFSRRQLHNSARLCRDQFGQASHAGRVLEAVAGRIPYTCRVPACQRFQTERKSWLKRWGLGRKRGFQVNEGMDVWIGIAGFCGVFLGALACIFTSSQKHKAEEAARIARAKAADVPPEGSPPADQATAAQQQKTGQKKTNDCCGDCSGCDCCCIDLPDCGGLEGCCDACDGCNGCDCNCN